MKPKRAQFFIDGTGGRLRNQLRNEINRIRDYIGRHKEVIHVIITETTRSFDPSRSSDTLYILFSANANTYFIGVYGKSYNFSLI